MNTNLTATPARWVPLLVLAGYDLEPGISTGFYERLPGCFRNPGEAMDAAEQAARQRPDAIGCSAKRVEVRNAA